MEIESLVHDWVKRRKLLGLKQQGLADEAGVSVSLIMKLESGHHENPTLTTLTKIESALSRLEAERAAQATGAFPVKSLSVTEYDRESSIDYAKQHNLSCPVGNVAAASAEPAHGSVSRLGARAPGVLESLVPRIGRRL